MSVRTEFELPTRGVGISPDTMRAALDAGWNEGSVYVRNGLNGEFLIVERLFVDDEGDVNLWLT